MAKQIQIFGISGIPEIQQGDDLPGLIHAAAMAGGDPIQDGDLIVVAQKVVSKAEGATVDLEGVQPSERARRLGERVRKDPRLVEVVLGQSRSIVRAVPGVLIVETIHGLVCANAGVDASNVAENGQVITLPADPDASASRIRDGLESLTGGLLCVVVSDSFGRPWREGSTNVAIGVAGFLPLEDARGRIDDHGRRLQATVVAVADELAAAAQLVMGEFGRTPVAIVRGADLTRSEGAGMAPLLRDPERDLFR